MNDAKQFMKNFNFFFGIPNIVGAIDGTHVILANAPKKNSETFFNRKKQYSIQCQAIVDTNGIFTDFLYWLARLHS